jgi:hypothetical protein
MLSMFSSARATRSASVLILFGHQSVGQNIIDGIGEMSRRGVETPEVIEWGGPVVRQSGMSLCHFRVGSNGQPLTKLQDFEDKVASEFGQGAQAAVFKFCYVDVEDESFVGPLFDEYVQTMERLQRRRPELTLGHVTIPLRSVPTGLVSTARRLLGQRHPQLARNRARHAFNIRMRERYSGTSTLFDLAAIESGDRVTDPALLSSYTEDGGHLNERGRRVVAEGFLDFLDRLAGLSGRGAAAH